MKKLLPSAVATCLVLGAAIATYLHPDQKSDVLPGAQYPDTTATESHTDPHTPDAGDNQTPSLDAVMSHPNVRRYLEREARKESLQAYFSDLESYDNAEAAWKLIDEIERDGGMLAYEVLALKLRWLEQTSVDKATFNAAAESLLDEYRQRTQHSVDAYDPYQDVPGFAEYKALERKIVAEVRALDRFPDGMSRDEYLRKRLQEAREQAYGS
ncbi:hypothetical protein [Microbulbifer pacificus]|uniref:hypothetical protein n=1 Tax=Microbulbifer pacificus TaxID=407164 RepID=UPI000CF5808B|nr:hypothetical protein [Microbulbifer pacificus]